jgi:sugar (pentulose or hexulose) kinase
MTTAPLAAGLDLGSTSLKVLIADAAGRELCVFERATPWQTRADGATELDADTLMAAVRSLLADAGRQLGRLGHAERAVGAIALSGMGESGLLVDPSGAAVAPAIAWFDGRGRTQLDQLPQQIRQEFPGRTGLPLGVQVSVVKLLMLRDQGVRLDGLRWLGLPEYVAAALGGKPVAEYSLASRTGILDQDTGRPWPQMLTHLGVTADFVPPLVTAGTDIGPLSVPWAPIQFRDARVTVAGHDHLVAATAGGALAGGGYYASMGTAEVLVRILDSPLPAAARARLAANLINYVRHVVPGQYVLVAGVKTGLLMRRVLQLTGINDRAGRDHLDAKTLALPVEGNLHAAAITVNGARNDDGVLALTIDSDGVSPAELFAATLRHGNDELARLIAVMDREVAPAHRTLLTGGWASMRSVQRARSHVLPHLEVSPRAQDTAYGATQFAAQLLAAHQPAQPS